MSEYKNRLLFLMTSITVLGSLCSAPFSLAQSKNSRVFSPDKKLYAYTKSASQMVSTGAGDVPASEIWIGDTATKKETVFVKAGDKCATGQTLGDLQIGDASDLKFSPDSKHLYFLCGAFAVSGAVIDLNLSTHKMKYVVDGNSLEIISNGKWKGNFAVSRHKYRGEKGAYDWEWVINPSNGKELGLWRSFKE